MAGRILSMQRQARELGRLRTGYTDGRRPVRSDTWIVTSHAEHYVQAAAEAWGGSVESWQPQGGGAPQWRVRTDTDSLDALLPSGDPLSQSMELWSGGGCARRCDGVTEMQSDRPCLCRAQFGEDFHLQPKGTVCAATTRLNVFLPEMPDVGVFRMESHSFFAAQEIAGAVDLIKSAVGAETVVPIRLRIEQRMRKSNGQTKKYPVIVVELRGITTGQVLGGNILGAPQREAIEAVKPRAIEAAPVKVDVDNIRAAILTAPSVDDLRAMWDDAKAAGLTGLVLECVKNFEGAEKTPSNPDAAANVGQNADQVWQRILAAVPEDWTTSQVEADFRKEIGVAAEDADAEQMVQYLAQLGGAG